MILIIAGMQRSGSTFSFNVAREIFGTRGGASALAIDSLEDVLALPNSTEHFIIKNSCARFTYESTIGEGWTALYLYHTKT